MFCKTKPKNGALVLLKIQIFIQLITAQYAGVKTRYTSHHAGPSTSARQGTLIRVQTVQSLEGQPHTVPSVAVPADNSPRAVHSRARVLDFRGVPSSAVREHLIPT